jgi:hypothetical protein
MPEKNLTEIPRPLRELYEKGTAAWHCQNWDYAIAILTQVYDETRRLAIAGSTVAPGDFRLKKLVEPLQKAGEKAPVFAKVAQAMAKVVESSEKTSADALLELSTLVKKMPGGFDGTASRSDDPLVRVFT